MKQRINAIIATGIAAFEIANASTSKPNAWSVLAISNTPEFAINKFCPKKFPILSAAAD